MTVIVGVLCEDGVVIGSDSSMTFTAGAQFKTIEQEAKKVFTLGDDLIFATTGAVGLGQRFYEVLTKIKGGFRKQSELDVAKLISRSAIIDLQETFVAPGQLGALVAFTSVSGVGLVELATSDFQPEIKKEMWFCSMGSGQPITDPFLAFIKRVLFTGSRPKLNEGVFVTYWALSHAIELNTGGIQGPPQIATLSRTSGKSTVKLLTEDDFGEPSSMLKGVEEHLRLYREKISGKLTTSIATSPPPAPHI